MREGNSFNPLIVMRKSVLEDHIKAGYGFFVRQSYPRGINHPMTKEALLITAYRDFMEASVHYDRIKYDRRKWIYHISDPWHLSQLSKAALQPEGYMIYISKFLNTFYHPLDPILHLIKRYVYERTNWRTDNIKDLSPTLSIAFGEIFVELALGDTCIKVSLEELEK